MLSRHAFRNALIPIITIIGLSIPEVVGAAVVTETVFSWPGLGLMLTEGGRPTRLPADHGHHDPAGDRVLIVNLLTDVAYGVADPRIRYS